MIPQRLQPDILMLLEHLVPSSTGEVLFSISVGIGFVIAGAYWASRTKGSEDARKEPLQEQADLPGEAHG